MKLLTLLCSLAMTFTSVAQTDLKKMDLPNNRVISITGHPDYPPVMWVNKETKQFQGIAIEMMKMIFNEIDVTPLFINVDTWARAQEEVKGGRIDMLLPPYKTEDRLAIYNYSADPFMADETVIFVKKGKEFKFETLNDLLKYPGVAIINDSFGTEFDKFELVHKNITRLSTTEQCFRFVEKDRARYIIAGANSGRAALTELNWDSRYTILPRRLIVTGMYAPLSMKSKWNTLEMNNYLKAKFEEYNRKGIVRQLEKKYLDLYKRETKAVNPILYKSAKPRNRSS